MTKPNLDICKTCPRYTPQEEMPGIVSASCKITEKKKIEWQYFWAMEELPQDCPRKDDHCPPKKDDDKVPPNP